LERAPRSFLSLTGASAAVAQPPQSESERRQSDTASGTSALLNLTTGFENTAGGFQALTEQPRYPAIETKLPE
jgi:hypothetical protein